MYLVLFFFSGVLQSGSFNTISWPCTPRTYITFKVRVDCTIQPQYTECTILPSFLGGGCGTNALHSARHVYIPQIWLPLCVRWYLLMSVAVGCLQVSAAFPAPDRHSSRCWASTRCSVCVRVQCSLYQQWAIWKILHLESWAERQLRKVVHRNSLVYNPPFINPLPSLHFILVFVEILGGDLGLSIHGLYSSCLCCDFNCTQASVCVCLLTGYWGSQLFGVWVTWWEVCDVCLRGKKADCPTFWC